MFDRILNNLLKYNLINRIQDEKLTLKSPITTKRLNIIPVAYGLITLSLFGLAVAMMNYRLFFGLNKNIVDLHLQHPLILDFALLLQFPILHSLFLGKARKLLFFNSTRSILKKLSITTYAFFASIQLLLVFLFWQFSGTTYSQPSGFLYWILSSLFVLSNVYLAKAMYDAGLGIQLGYSGWLAAAKNENVKYPCMPEKGTFKYCRQPIYFSFFLILWLSPIMTLDKLLLASLWSLYCFIGPLFKENRFKKFYKEKFENYKLKTPYFIPNWKVNRR